MLVLQRREGEEIIISCGNELVRVELVRLGSASARIGITAPAHIGVDRKEVWEAKQGWHEPGEQEVPCPPSTNGTGQQTA